MKRRNNLAITDGIHRTPKTERKTKWIIMGKYKGIVDAHGRQCAYCGDYKLWEHFHKDKTSTTVKI